jgi:hypothetical protein
MGTGTKTLELEYGHVSALTVKRQSHNIPKDAQTGEET